MLTSAPFEGLDGSAVQAISGDLGDDGLERRRGLRHRHPLRRVASPSSRRWTRRSSSTARARRGCCKALRDAGGDPYFIHVSTAYAAGQRTGLVLERPSGTAPSEPWLDLDAELDAGQDVARATSRPSRACPLHQHRFVKEAQRAVGPAGGPATGTRAEILRYEWVRDQLTERGRERARALGWSDTYGLSQGDRRARADGRATRGSSRSSARRSSSPRCTRRTPAGWSR